jgi:hypothetical protein
MPQRNEHDARTSSRAIREGAGGSRQEGLGKEGAGCLLTINNHAPPQLVIMLDENACTKTRVSSLGARKSKSGGFLPLSPPAEQTTATQHQTWQTSTDDGSGNGGRCGKEPMLATIV